MQRVARWPYVALAIGGLFWIVVALVFATAVSAQWSEVELYLAASGAQLAQAVAVFATGIGLAGVVESFRSHRVGGRLAATALGVALLAAAAAGVAILFAFAGHLAPSPLRLVGLLGPAALGVTALATAAMLRRAATPWWAMGLLMLAALVTLLVLAGFGPLGSVMPAGTAVAFPVVWASAGLALAVGGLLGRLLPSTAESSPPASGRATRGLGRVAGAATGVVVVGAGLLGAAAMAWPPGPQGNHYADIIIDGEQVRPASRFVACHQVMLDLPDASEREPREPHLTIDQDNGTATIWLEMPMREGEYSEVEDYTIQREAEGIESVEFGDERVQGHATLPPRFPDFTNAEPVEIEFDIRCEW